MHLWLLLPFESEMNGTEMNATQSSFNELACQEGLWPDRQAACPAKKEPEEFAELAEFKRRLILGGCSAASARTDEYKIRALLSRARSRVGGLIGPLDLVRNATLAAAVCNDDQRRDGKAGRVTVGTLA